MMDPPVVILLPQPAFKHLATLLCRLNNGRLAMIAIAAFVAQELRVQQPIFENLGSKISNSTV